MKKKDMPLNLTEKNKSKLSLMGSIVVLLLLCVLLHSLDKSAVQMQKEISAAEETKEQQQAAQEEAAKVQTYTASIGAAGDNLYYNDLLNAGKSETGQWNYDNVYAQIKNKISGYDLSIVSQGSIFTDNHDAVSGPPSFATPWEVGDALVTAGFDIIASASENTDAYGSELINETLNFWNTKYPDTTVLGIHPSAEEADTVQILDVNNIKIALLNYSYGSDFNNLTDEDSYLVDYFQKDKVTADIQKARELSDCIILAAQWGDDANAVPTEYQAEWSNYLMTLGVDVVIGGSPQVLQPYEMLSDQQGNEMLVFYSLGSFATSQEDIPRLLGGIGEFTIEKTISDKETTVKITNSSISPTIMHYNTGENVYQVYPLEAYTDELAASHTIATMDNGEYFTKENLQKLYDYIMAITPSPSTKTDLVDAVYNSDKSMTKADGTTLSQDEISLLNPEGDSGTMERLNSVLTQSTPPSSLEGSENGQGTDSLDSSKDSDSYDSDDNTAN